MYWIKAPLSKLRSILHLREKIGFRRCILCNFVNVRYQSDLKSNKREKGTKGKSLLFKKSVIYWYNNVLIVTIFLI